MPMVVITTRNVEPRYRGFLSSAMLELSAGVYAHPRMSVAVRQRIWTVLSDWYAQLGIGSILMTWADTAKNGGLGIRVLGEPPRDIVAHDATLLVRRPLRHVDKNHLTSEC